MIVSGEYINKNYHELYHFSKNVFNGVMIKKEKSLKKMKPDGIWFSNEEYQEDGWANYCKIEKYALENLKFKTKVKFKRWAKILLILCPDQLEIFAQLFNNDKNYFCGYYINWNKVASIFDVIFIPNYLRSQRLKASAGFYYGWDVASGCIMNPDCFYINS